MNIRAVCLLGLLFPLSPVFAQQFVGVQKQASYVQMNASGSVSASTIGSPAYDFSVQAPAAGTFTRPGASAITLPFDSDDNKAELTQGFATLAYFNLAYPNGTYLINVTGLPAISDSITGDLYPSTVPQVTGGTWQNNVYVLDPTKSNTITFNTFAGYTATGGGQIGAHMNIGISSWNGVDNVNLKQDYSTISFTGTTQSATPFASYTIPAGTLHAGGVYKVSIDFDTATTLDKTTAAPTIIFGIYENELNFYMACPPTSNAPAAPSIIVQPISFAAPVGSSATFAATYSPASQNNGSNFTTAFWNVSTQQPASTTRYTINYGSDSNSSPLTTLTVNTVAAADAGTYVFAVLNPSGLVYAQPVSLTIGAASTPMIVSQPQNSTVKSGNSAAFSVTAAGVGPFTYQWLFNGNAISGATSSTYGIGSASAANAGAYSVVVGNSGSGTVTSGSATLTVSSSSTPPSFTTNPSNQTVVSGTTVVFTVGVAGSPTPSLQWMYNGVAIGGANSTRLVVSNATAANTGNYTCFASNSSGSLISTPGTLSIDSSPADVANPGRLINLSVNTAFVPGMTLGFSSGGAGTSGTQTLLVRASGPALTPYYGASGVLPDPTLTLYNSAGAQVAVNAGWSSNSSNQTLVTAADAATYAFALTPGSLDSATVVTLPPGTGTMIVGSTGNNSGRTIAEIYDDTAAGAYRLTAPRLINVSCKILVAANGSVTAGFTVGGSTAKSVLIRASGPALAAFGVAGVMPDPQLTAYNSAGAVITRNAGWGGDPQLTAAMTQVYAFTYTSASSADSAVLLTLPAGSYTAQASSVSGTAGVTLVEVYEVP